MKRKPITLEEVNWFRENFEGQIDSAQVTWLVNEVERFQRALQDIENVCQSEFESSARVARKIANKALKSKDW